MEKESVPKLRWKDYYGFGLHLEVWHMVVLVAEPLHELVYLGALDGLGAGEGVEAGVLGLVGGQQQHQLGARVGEAGNRMEMNTTHIHGTFLLSHLPHSASETM